MTGQDGLTATDLAFLADPRTRRRWFTSTELVDELVVRRGTAWVPWRSWEHLAGIVDDQVLPGLPRRYREGTGVSGRRRSGSLEYRIGPPRGQVTADGQAARRKLQNAVVALLDAQPPGAWRAVDLYGRYLQLRRAAGAAGDPPSQVSFTRVLAGVSHRRLRIERNPRPVYHISDTDAVGS